MSSCLFVLDNPKELFGTKKEGTPSLLVVFIALYNCNRHHCLILVPDSIALKRPITIIARCVLKRIFFKLGNFFHIGNGSIGMIWSFLLFKKNQISLSFVCLLLGVHARDHDVTRR
jgi:hypothetical protein